MAERRMMKRQIVLSDGFLKLDDPSQLLYYQLMLEADDDGFIANPLTLVRMVDSRKEHLETLVEHGYLIQFPSGVVLVKHWFQHNYIRPDRHHKSVLPEKKLVTLTEDKVYISTEECNGFGGLCPDPDRTGDSHPPWQRETICLPDERQPPDRKTLAETFARPHCDWVSGE